MWLFDRFKPKEEKTKAAGNMQQLDSPLIDNFLIAGQKKEQKFNSNALLLLYENVSQVNSVVNYIAAKGADIPIKHVKYLGNGKTKDLGETEIIKSLRLPNKGASQNSFVNDIITQYIIQGNVPILKERTPGFISPTSYQVLNPPDVYQIPQWSIDQYGTPAQGKANYLNPIVSYKHEMENGHLNMLDINDVIYIKDVNPRKVGKDFYYGASRLHAATRSINVLSNVYDTINTILAAKGALGFISRQTTAGELDPMQWKESIEEIERRINKDYGTTKGKKSIMATYANLKWNRMDSPINDFIPVELTNSEFSQLCNQMGGMPDVLLNSKAASTYNNLETALKAFYLNVLSPILTDIYNTMSINLGMTKTNEWLVADYSNISALNEEQLDKIKFMLESELITKNQALEMLGMPNNTDESFNTIGDGSEIKTD